MIIFFFLICRKHHAFVASEINLDTEIDLVAWSIIIVYFYRDAAMMPMRRNIEGLRLDQIAAMKDQLVQPSTMKDFEMALDKVKKTVSKDDLSKYENWMKEFGCV